MQVFPILLRGHAICPQKVSLEADKGISDSSRDFSNAKRSICQEILGVAQSQISKIIPDIDGISPLELILEIRVRHFGQKSQVFRGNGQMIIPRQPIVDFRDSHDELPMNT